MHKIRKQYSPMHLTEIFGTRVIVIGYILSSMIGFMLGQVVSNAIQQEQVTTKVAVQEPIEAAVHNTPILSLPTSSPLPSPTVSPTPDPSEDPELISRGSIDRLSKETLDVFARLVWSEAADEDYEGMVAVAAVVLNRVECSYFPDSIEEVIFDKGQFNGTKLKIFKDPPREICIEAVLEALSGKDPTNGALFFVNLKRADPEWAYRFELLTRIGDHWFYKP